MFLFYDFFCCCQRYQLLEHVGLSSSSSSQRVVRSRRGVSPLFGCNFDQKSTPWIVVHGCGVHAACETAECYANLRNATARLRRHWLLLRLTRNIRTGSPSMTSLYNSRTNISRHRSLLISYKYIRINISAMSICSVAGRMADRLARQFTVAGKTLRIFSAYNFALVV